MARCFAPAAASLARVAFTQNGVSCHALPGSGTRGRGNSTLRLAGRDPPRHPSTGLVGHLTETDLMTPLAAACDPVYGRAPMVFPNLAFLAQLDPRPVVLACFGAGIFTWQAPPLGVLAFLLFFVGLCLLTPRHSGAWAGPFSWRGGLLFVGLWMAIHLALAVWSAGWEVQATHLQEAGVLGLRLGALLAIGAALTGLVSAPRLCRAVTWGLRPVLGARAWEPSLALALMLHFIPMISQTAVRLRLAMRCRQLPLGRREQTQLFLQALLRAIAQLPWRQTMALAARELDSEKAWQWQAEPGMHTRPAWCASLVFLIACGWVAFA